jgi:hypothetical protein
MLTLADGMSYTLVSPGRRGYKRARVVPWPEFDVAYNPDTSLVITLRSQLSRRPFGDT